VEYQISCRSRPHGFAELKLKRAFAIDMEKGAWMHWLY
jgi:hypothetical protein